jgi:hypothetical protein
MATGVCPPEGLHAHKGPGVAGSSHALILSSQKSTMAQGANESRSTENQISPNNVCVKTRALILGAGRIRDQDICYSS